MSTLDTSISNRTIQTIIRGNWPAMEEEVKQERRRARLYIVATDLSDEALYALEWTIGTILRDGDTMIAMYAIDEEAAGSKGSESDAKSNVQFGEGVKAAQDMARSMAVQTEKTKQHPIVAHNSSMLVPSNYMPATETKSLTGSVDSRAMSKQEIERLHAVDNISQTCIRLLRKTRLQVRIFVEVIHCKSPKHMLTGAVSYLSVTAHASTMLIILDRRPRAQSRHPWIKRSKCSQRCPSRIFLELSCHQVCCAGHGRAKEAKEAREGSS